MHARADRIETPAIRLRPTEPRDLPALFDMQCDPASNEMAGTKARTREVYFTAWEGHLVNPSLRSRVIEMDGVIVGSIGCFQVEGQNFVGYWIARDHWGRGIASRALALFLCEEDRRPLHATTDAANARSRRILEKCGFRCTGSHMGEETDRYVAREVAEFVLE